MYDTTFDSTEKAYQHCQAKATRINDLANEKQNIREAKHAGVAKRLSKQIPKDFGVAGETQNVINVM